MSAFSASDEKVERAERKVRDLKTSINRFLGDNLYSRIESDFDGHHIVAGIRQPIDPDIKFEVVEAVGHLRSALDKMIAALVRDNSRGGSGAQFPFGGLGDDGKPQPFPTSRHDGIKKKITPEQWTLILAQKPYPGGNDTLWSVNTVANSDKHGTELVTVFPTATTNPEFTEPITVGVNFEKFVWHGANNSMLGKDKMEARIFTHGLGNKFDVKHKVTGRVIFSKVAPVHGKDVLETLDAQIRLVKGVLKDFSPTLKVP